MVLRITMVYITFLRSDLPRDLTWLIVGFSVGGILKLTGSPDSLTGQDPGGGRWYIF